MCNILYLHLFGTVLGALFPLRLDLHVSLSVSLYLCFVTDLWSGEEARTLNSVHYVSADHRLQHQSTVVL